MNRRRDAQHGATLRHRDDHRERGAVLVEAAIVANLLFLLLFGIVTAGLALSYRQNMVHAANDAARAGAVTDDLDAALTAAQSAVAGFDRTCNEGGLSCRVEQIACPFSTTGESCIRVVLEHDNEEHPVVTPLPLVSNLLPDTMHVEAIAVVNP